MTTSITEPERDDDRLPLGPHGEFARAKDGRFAYRPPNIAERFWAWPVGFTLLLGITALIQNPTPLLYFGAGALVVAVWHELRYQTVRGNHQALWAEIRRLRQERGTSERRT